MEKDTEKDTDGEKDVGGKTKNKDLIRSAKHNERRTFVFWILFW